MNVRAKVTLAVPYCSDGQNLNCMSSASNRFEILGSFEMSQFCTSTITSDQHTLEAVKVGAHLKTS